MNIMLDLETMGTSPDAAIVAIGAVEFDIVTRALGRTFYCNVDLESAVADGGVIDANTVMWWMRQGDDARRGLLNNGMTIHQALNAFSDWVTQFGDDEKLVWGNGATFDNVILPQAYKRAGLLRPWKYSGDRCYRTMKTLRPEIAFLREGTHHNALDDAISQAEHLMAIYCQLT